MIVPTASHKGGGWQDLATVAKDEKIRLPVTVYAKNRYQDHISHDKFENHLLDEQRQRVGKYLASDFMKSIILYWLMHGN